MRKHLIALLMTAALLLAACGGRGSFAHTWVGSSWLTTSSGSAFVVHDERHNGEYGFRVTSLIDDSVGGTWTAPGGAYVNALSIFESSILVSAEIDGVYDYYMIDQQGSGTKVVADSDALKAALAALLYDRPYLYQTPFAGGVTISSNLRPDLRSDALPDLYLLGADLSIRPIEIEGAPFPFGVKFFAAGDDLYAVVPSAPDASDGLLIRLDENLKTFSTASLRDAARDFGAVEGVGDQLLAYFGGSDCPEKRCYAVGTDTYLLTLNEGGETELAMLTGKGDLTPVENLGQDAWLLGTWKNEDVDRKIAVVDGALYLTGGGALLRVVDGAATPVYEGKQMVSGIVDLRVVNGRLWIATEAEGLYEYRVFDTSQK